MKGGELVFEMADAPCDFVPEGRACATPDGRGVWGVSATPDTEARRNGNLERFAAKTFWKTTERNEKDA